MEKKLSPYRVGHVEIDVLLYMKKTKRKEREREIEIRMMKF